MTEVNMQEANAEGVLTESQHVLEHFANGFGRTTFAQPNDEFDGHGAPYTHRTWSMRTEDWVDMGQPEQITVTIVPGDRLNS